MDSAIGQVSERKGAAAKGFEPAVDSFGAAVGGVAHDHRPILMPDLGCPLGQLGARAAGERADRVNSAVWMAVSLVNYAGEGGRVFEVNKNPQHTYRPGAGTTDEKITSLGDGL